MLGASRTEDNRSVEENETFPDPEIGIGVPLTTSIDLTSEGIRELSNDRLLVI